MKNLWRVWALGAVVILTTIGITQRRDLRIANDKITALQHQISQMTPCDQAVKESRHLLELQIKLRNNSIKEVANDIGYDTRSEFDHQSVARY